MAIAKRWPSYIGLVSVAVLCWPLPAMAAGVLSDGNLLTVVLAGALVLSFGCAVIFWRRYRAADAVAAGFRKQASTAHTVASLGTEQAIFWTGVPVPGADDEQATPGLSALIGADDPSTGWFAALAGLLGSDDSAALTRAVKGLRAEGTPFVMECRTADGVRSFAFRGEYGSGNLAVLLICEQTASVGRIDRLTAEVRRLNRLLDVVNVPVWLCDEFGQMKYINPAYRRAVDIDDSVPPEDAPPLVMMTEDSGAPNLDAGPRVRKKHVVIEGQRRFVEAVEVPLADLGVSAGFAIDITALEDTQAELSRLVTGQDVLLQSLGTAIALYDSDQRLQSFNNAYLQLWGLDEAWLRSRPTMGEVLEVLRDRRRLMEQSDFPAFKRDQIDRFMSLIEPKEEMAYLPDGTTLRSVAIPHPFGGLLLLWEDVTDTLALERN